jgi:hypothetical protein
MEFIFYIYCRHNVKKGKTLNPAAEHHSSPQSCIVRPETCAGQSLLGGIEHLDGVWGLKQAQRQGEDRVTSWISLSAHAFPTFSFVFLKLCFGQTCYAWTGIECIKHLPWFFFLPSLTICTCS